MITQLSVLAATRVLRIALVLLLVTAVLSQIPQDRPELCGPRKGAIPLPPGTTFALSRGSSDFTLRLKDGTLKVIDLEAPEEVQQVCPIKEDRLLVFGAVGGGDGPFVWILNQVDGARLDLIGSRNPVLSPDQHWIAYRKFYGRFSEIFTDEYLLYDLTKDRAGNLLPSEVPAEGNPPGRQMYPATAKHVPFNNILYDPKRVHTFASDSFFWSPDSKYLVFADRLGVEEVNATSIVLVKVQTNSLTTYVHPLGTKEMCGGIDLGPGVASGATLYSVDFGNVQGDLPEIWASFTRENTPGSIHPSCAKPLHLRSGDFKPAAVEVHAKPNRGVRK
jgi:hypothetical protein